jgi:hypothetical protein
MFMNRITEIVLHTVFLKNTIDGVGGGENGRIWESVYGNQQDLSLVHPEGKILLICP